MQQAGYLIAFFDNTLEVSFLPADSSIEDVATLTGLLELEIYLSL